MLIDKDTFKAIKERQKIASVVKDNGGSVAFMLSKKTTHLIVDVPSSLLLSLESLYLSGTPPPTTTISHSLIYQLNTAIRQNILIASLDFITESIKQNTLATQYIANFTREIQLFAREIPFLVSAVDIPNDQAADQADDKSTLSPDASLPSSADPQPQPENPEDDAPPLAPMTTLAYSPVVLDPPIPSKQFTPLQILENDKPCRLMSLVESEDQDLTFSFEENRFYNYCVTGETTETCLALPERPESKMGSIWSWGRGSKGQLGCGQNRNNLMPTFIPEDFLEPVIQIACGDYFSAAVTSDGSVWTWGAGSHGCLGHGDERGSDIPRLVEAFTDVKVSMVACGKSHCAALTDIGTVWTWGNNRKMQLGYDTLGESKSLPEQVFSIKHAVFVACGGDNTAVLDKYGNVYTLGCNTYGQRGIGKQSSRSIAGVTKVPFMARTNIKYISVGQGFMGALSVEGEAYTWGRNLENQCGNGSATDVYEPQKIDVGTEVIHISCGDTHAACVTANGDVYTWGWGPVGQLGHAENMPTCTVPTHVESVSDVCMVACGARHTVALGPDRGKVWVWGSNEHAQSGILMYESFDDDDETEDDEDTTTWLSPQIIDSLSRVSLVACGKNHTLALVEREYIPIQFTKDGNSEYLYMWLENSSKLRDLDDAAFKTAVESIRDDELGSDYTLLHWAAHYDCANVLTLLAGEKWVDPNITDRNGDTPLHICAERDLPDSARILLSCGAKPDHKNKLGKTAIHVSVENRSSDVLREFVENATANKSVVDESGNTPLHTAIRLRHFEMAKYLIEHAAQPQILDKSGKTAMDYCSFKEASYFKSLAQKNDVFISYAHADLTFATKIKEYLELHSIKCWMDMTRLEAGNDWRLDIGTGLLNSRLVLFIGSRASVVSDWCIKELHMAKKHKLVIIPIWFQKVEYDSEVKSLIFGRGFIDFSIERKFNSYGRRLARKLKYVLSIVKSSRPNPYLEIPHLTTAQLWQQLFLTIMIESYTHFLAGHALENVLHRSAIFSCTHSIEATDNIDHSNMRAENLERTWGIVFLVHNLKLVKTDLEKWWRYADANKKRVYLCMIRGSASDIKTDDLPAQALVQTSVPIFYLESESSMQQLIYFVHLAQRDEFMAKQVGVVEDKLVTVSTQIKDNQNELEVMKKRFYVGSDQV